MEKCIPLDNPNEWNKALSGLKHAFGQTWENCYAMYLSTGFPTYLYSFEEGEIHIVCPFSERSFGGFTDIVTPYGFSGFVGNRPYPEFPNLWRKFVKERGYVCGYINLNPIFEDSSYLENHDVHESNQLYVLDLNQPIDGLFSNLSYDRRYKLRNWRSDFAKITEDRPTVRNFFLNKFHEFLKNKNAKHAYYFSDDTLSYLSNLENVIIAGVLDMTEIVAINVFAYTPYAGESLFNISTNRGRHYSALLIWYGVQRLKSLGVPSLNMGGGIRDNDGIAKFKQRFGTQVYPMKSLKQVYNPRIYEELCRMVQADPDDRLGYFPPYHKP